MAIKNKKEEEEKKRKRARYLELQAKSSFSITDIKPTEPELLRKKAAVMRGQRPQEIQKAQQEAFQSIPGPQRVTAGLGKMMYKTGAGPLKRFMGQGEEVESTLGAYEAGAQGDPYSAIGEIGGEIGMLAGPLSKIDKLKYIQKMRQAGKGGLAAMEAGGLGGAISAGMHQAQRYGGTGKISPLEAGMETAASALIPGAGQKTGEALKKVAPQVLRTAVKPSRKAMRGATKPVFDVPLEKGMVKPTGGLETVSDNLTTAIKSSAEKRDDIVKKSGIKINITGAISEANKKLKKMLQDKDITIDEYEKAVNYGKRYAKRTAAESKTAKGTANLFVGSEDAIGIRKLADKGTKWSMAKNDTAPPKSLFNAAYRDAIEKQMKNRLNQKNVIERIGPDNENLYKSLNKEMSKLIPTRNAINDRIEQAGNNYKFGLLDYTALGAGGALGGFGGYQDGSGSPGTGAALGALGLLGVRRLTSTPGGASMLYSAGKRLTTPSRTKDLIMQAGRSGFNTLGGQ